MNIANDNARISEQELVVPALELMASRPNGFILTTVLISELESRFAPTGQDGKLLHDRCDSHFSQKVRNLVSHRDSESSFIAQGLATYRDHGLEITSAGRFYIFNAAA